MALCQFATNVRAGGSHVVASWGWVDSGRVFRLRQSPFVVMARASVVGLATFANVMLDDRESFALTDLDVAPNESAPAYLVAPLGRNQEVWAAGVTYESSKFARMAESAEGGDFYARVYAADRPELFFKATPSRTVGPNAEVRIRADSRWNVPEPELAAVVAANGRILGYTIGNDMSSRDIEGANPLYLPQAKVYRGSCALGPVIVPAETLGDPHALGIRLTITRGGATAFAGETSTARMKRRVEELVQWLFRENDFPHGVILLTGTGIIPPDDFTLQPGDEIAIEIDRIGTLRNTVAALDNQKTF